GPEQLAELRTLGDIVGFVTGLSEGPATDVHTTVTDATATEPLASEPPSAAAPAAIGRGHAALLDLPVPDRLVGAYPQGATALVVDDGSTAAEVTAARLGAAGWQVRVLRLPGVPQRVTG
ncbi:hypothetical protein, partial [Streptomyces viridochromogenes]